MVFTSHVFVFYFLPLVLAGYYLLPRGRNAFLLAASYLFYAWWNPAFVVLMFVVTAINYGGAKVIGTPGASAVRRHAAVVVSVAASLGLLGFFKYFVFMQDNLNGILAAFGAQPLGVWRIVLPVGISFYTFQSLSYTVDVYRGVCPPVRSFTDFACFVALFPQLIAGPILRYNAIAPQLRERTHTLDKFAGGAALFILGFARKILLANSVGQVADIAFAADGLLPLDAWFGAAAYAFQIYFDFAAYSDMAVGLGRMLGFEFDRNFNAPCRAESITDFWRRWHISLSTFLRDYLYVPLGGNRRGPRRTYINLAVVMLLGGLWHGANWTFVLWGAWHGVLLIIERAANKRSLYRLLPRAVRIGITFVLVLFGWVLFRSDTVGEAMHYLAAMFARAPAAPGAMLVSARLYTPANLSMMVLCAVLAFGPLQAFEYVRRITWPKVVLLIVLFVVSLMAMSAQAFNPFLYFQF